LECKVGCGQVGEVDFGLGSGADIRYRLQRTFVSLGSSFSSPPTATPIIEPTTSPSSTYESDPVDPADAVFTLYLNPFLMFLDSFTLVRLANHLL
jgi:hypothetical protein